MCYHEIGLPYYYLSFQLLTNKTKTDELSFYQVPFQLYTAKILFF